MQAMQTTLSSLGQRRGTGYLAALLGITAMIAVCATFRNQLSNATVALVLVLVVLGVATLWGRRPGIVASVLGMLCFNFFFLPPLYTLTIADPENWITLAAFFITASSTGHLSVTVKRRAAEAEAGRQALQQSVHDIHQAADEIHDLYNHAPCGYHSLDTHGTFVRINDTELAWLGYTREEVIGKMHFTDLLTPEGVRIFQEYFPKFKAAGVMRDLEFELVRKDGTFLPVLISATAITDRNGNYLMSRATVYDITARQHAENEIRMLAHLQAEVAALGERALRCARSGGAGESHPPGRLYVHRLGPVDR